MTRKPKIPVSEKGIPLGEHHHRSTIPDEAVEAMLLMARQGLGWRRIARAFPEWNMWTIRNIIAGKRRNVTPAAWKDADG